MQRRRLHTLLLLPLLTLIVTLVSTPGRATNWAVSMGDDDLFHPDLLTIAVGDSITWTNNDSDDHTSTSGLNCTPDGMWDSGDVHAGATYGLAFTSAGTFPYHCTHHCAFGMVGTITVMEIVPTRRDTWGQIKLLYASR